jgi:hypothetical protein
MNASDVDQPFHLVLAAGDVAVKSPAHSIATLVVH